MTMRGSASTVVVEASASSVKAGSRVMPTVELLALMFICGLLTLVPQ